MISSSPKEQKLEMTSPMKELTKSYDDFNDTHISSPDDKALISENEVWVLKFIKLNPGVTKVNFHCCMVLNMAMFFSFTAANTLQPLILLDKDYYNIDRSMAGRITSMILAVQMIVKVIVSVPFGHYSDMMGRKCMMLFGITCKFLSFVIIPMQTTIFPGLIIAKILFANGQAALHAVPLLADYIHDDSKGKAAGIFAMTAAAAKFSSNQFVKYLFVQKVSLGSCYMIVGGFVFIVTLIASFGIKGKEAVPKPSLPAMVDSSHSSTISDLEQASNGATLNYSGFKDKVKEGFRILNSNAWLMIALVLQVFGSSDFFIFFTYITLYVKTMFPEDAESSFVNTTVANIHTYVLLPGFFCNFLYGYFLDKANKAIYVIYIAIFGAITAFICVIFTENYTDIHLKIGALLIGATIPGMFIIMTYLNNKNFPPDKRGLMVGFTHMAGNVGFFVFTSIGGIAYDGWRREGPFIIASILLTIALILITRIYKKRIALF